MKPVRWLRMRRLEGALARRAEDYSRPSHPSEVRSAQLAALNAAWGRALAEVPYFRELRARRDLPEAFGTLEEFVDRVPATKRETVKREMSRMTSRARPPQVTRMTGGSSAEPVQLPGWRAEIVHTGVDQWMGRAWYGVTPGSTLFLLWGHSHLLGAGLRGWINARRRSVQDLLVGYHRFSAYDLRPERLRAAGDRLLRFRPEALFGYSVALDLFARVNHDRAEAFRALGLRAVIGTAEAFPAADSPSLLAGLFGCPVAMEYGAAETGMLAHMHPAGGYRTFWRSVLLDAERSGASTHVVRVTSLHPRCFPLVRYEIGDEIEIGPGAPERVVGLTTFERVVGRCNDYVVLPDGARIHSEAFTHAVRPCPEVMAYQVVQDSRGIRIRYTGDRDLDPATADGIRARLSKIHPELETVGVERVERIPQTRAGKTRMVVIDPPPS